MKWIFKKVDQIFCTYLGLESEEVSPNLVTLKNNQLMILYTESFKRYTYFKNWNNFSSINFNQLSQTNKTKLGIAIGKIIAKNLNVSFDGIKITAEESDA